MADQMSNNDYEFWERALAGEEVGGPTLPLHENEVHSGFFRMRNGRGTPYRPVAIWRDDSGALIGLLSGRETNPSDIWLRCANHPVSEEAYHDYMKSGHWFDEDQAISESLKPPPAGHNAADKFDTLSDQINSALKGVETYATITSDDQEKQAQSKRARLNELHGEADKERDVLKRPFLEGGQAVDRKWQPIVKSAKAGADKIAAALSAYATKKRNAEIARLAAERQKAVQEAQKHAPLGDDVAVAEAPVAAPVMAPVKGGYGRAASKKVIKIATVTDLDKVFAFFKAQPEVSELLQKLAQKSVDAGFTVPGVLVAEEVKVV